MSITLPKLWLLCDNRSWVTKALHSITHIDTSTHCLHTRDGQKNIRGSRTHLQGQNTNTNTYEMYKIWSLLSTIGSCGTLKLTMRVCAEGKAPDARFADSQKNCSPFREENVWIRTRRSSSCNTERSQCDLHSYHFLCKAQKMSRFGASFCRAEGNRCTSVCNSE